VAFAHPVASASAVPTAPRARGAVVSFEAAARRLRAAPRAGGDAAGGLASNSGPPAIPHRARDAARTPLARAALLSLLIHALAIGGLALFVGVGGSGRGVPFTGATLVATLASPPKSAPLVAAPAPAPIAPSAQAASTAPVPLPIAPKPRATAFKGSAEGMATINLVAEDHPVDPAVVALIARSHPDAVRGRLEFDPQPRGIYPLAAVEKRLQIDFVVPVVVLEDGRVEVANGTFDDPLFGAAIRAGLREARARPAVNAAGRTVPLWGLLSFAFEFVGGQPEAK
jgi:hypothetical protein